MKTTLPSLTSFLLVLAIAASATFWYLQLTSTRAPREPVLATPAGDATAHTQPLDTAAAARLFGASSAAGPSSVRLLGVIAEGGNGKGVALLSVDGNTALAFKAGEAIGGRFTLAEVRADRVIIRSGTGTREIRMPARVPPAGIEPVR